MTNLTTFCAAANALRVMRHADGVGQDAGTAASFYGSDLALIQVGDSQGADMARGADDWWPLTIRGETVGEMRDDASGMTIHVGDWEPKAMAKTTASYISNNGFDALVICDPANGNRIHMIDGAETFRDAMAVGDAQDLDNWSGDMTDEAPETIGEVLAVNDGVTLKVLDADRLAARREFFRA